MKERRKVSKQSEESLPTPMHITEFNGNIKLSKVFGLLLVQIDL